MRNINADRALDPFKCVQRHKPQVFVEDIKGNGVIELRTSDEFVLAE